MDDAHTSQELAGEEKKQRVGLWRHRWWGMLALLLLPCWSVLEGCSAAMSPTEAAQASFDLTMSQIKNANEETIESFIGEGDTELESLGVNPNELYKALTKHFSYTIDDAREVNSNEVVLTISSQNVDLAQVIQQWKNGLQSFVQEKIASGDISSDSSEYTAELMQMFMDDLTASDVPLTSAQTEVVLKDGANGWDTTDSENIQRMFFAGQSPADLNKLMAAQ